MTFKNFMSKYGSGILTGIGIIGMGTTTVLAVRATPTALERIEEEKKRLKKEQLSFSEKVKATWKCYIPSALTFVGSSACLIGSDSIQAKHYKVLAAAYSITNGAYKEFKSEVKEAIGEKKEKEIEHRVAEKRLNKDPVDSKEVIVTNHDQVLCYDSVFGRYFKSDVDTIQKAINQINRDVATSLDGFASVNDFYDYINVPPIKIGKTLGWVLDDGEVDIIFSSKIADNGTPCLVLTYSVSPKMVY